MSTNISLMRQPRGERRQPSYGVVRATVRPSAWPDSYTIELCRGFRFRRASQSKAYVPRQQLDLVLPR